MGSKPVTPREADPLPPPDEPEAQFLIPLQSAYVGDNIQASETLALALPTLGLIPCVIYAAIVYRNPTLTFTECSRNLDPPAFLPIAFLGGTQIYEPFSTTTNVCYWLAGLSIYLYQIFNYAFLFPQMYAHPSVVYCIVHAQAAADTLSSRTTTILQVLARVAPHDSWSWERHLSRNRLCRRHVVTRCARKWRRARSARDCYSEHTPCLHLTHRNKVSPPTCGARQADIYGIYALFAGLTGTSFLGLYYGCKGRSQNPTDWLVLPLVTTATFVLMAFSIAYWRQVNQMVFLFLTGAVIIISNASVAGVYSYRERDGESPRLRWRAAVIAFVTMGGPRLFVLICAFILNLGGRATMNTSFLQSTCAEATDMDEVARRIELLKRWDFIHGVWHFLSACALTAMGLSAQEGLMGTAIPRGISYSRARCPEWCLTRCAIATNEFVEELISRLVLAVFAVLCVILYAAEASSGAWITFLVVTCVFILPLWTLFGTFHVLRIARQNISASIDAQKRSA